MPAPQPVPVAPTQDRAAEEQRLNAERAAIADQKARGRASTIAAGGDIAAEEQYNRGLLKKKQRTASREMFG
jgi:hypothetical protein